MDLMSIALAKAMGGGGGLFVVTVDTVAEYVDDYVFYSATSDKSAEEISNAWKAGELPIVKITGDAANGDAKTLYLNDLSDEDGEYYAIFFGAHWDISGDGDDKLIDVRASMVNISVDGCEYYSGYGGFPAE